MRHVIVSVSLLFVLLGLPFVFIIHKRAERLDRGRYINTKNGLLRMGDAIEYLSWQLNGQVPETLHEVVEQLGETDLHLMKTYHDPTIETGVYRDAWGSPVHFQKMGDSKYLLISNGPNRKFENGGGDDISYEFYITPSPNVPSLRKNLSDDQDL